MKHKQKAKELIMNYNKDIASILYFDDNKPQLIRLDIRINGHRKIKELVSQHKTNVKRNKA